MYQKLNIPVIGIIENMSYYVCGGCGTEADIFGRGGGELALELGVPYLGAVPLAAPVRSGGDAGRPIVLSEPNSPAAQALSSAAARVAQQVSIASCAESHPADANQLIPFTKHSLGNGLQVVVHEDHHLPVVAVNIWYHVGSRNEAPGRSGLAHLFEHLMFKGAQHQPRGFRTAAGSRQLTQRVHQRRSCELLVCGAHRRHRAGAVDGSGSNGMARAL